MNSTISTTTGQRIYKTRFKELGFMQQARNCWRFVDLTDWKPQQVPVVIGAQYHSKAELLADLTRYAEQFGCEV